MVRKNINFKDHLVAFLKTQNNLNFTDHVNRALEAYVDKLKGVSATGSASESIKNKK